MLGDKLNTAEHDEKGRCIRHPDVRLRKKKLLGGWKILIGHCPECCLDEMRRVRDEIEGDSKKKKKKVKHTKKSKKRDKLPRRGSHEQSQDRVSVTSEGYDPHHSRALKRDGVRNRREDGESETTESTTQMSGGGSVISEHYYREGGHHRMRSPGHMHHGSHNSDGFRGYDSPPPMYKSQAMNMRYAQERTMVLSMSFIDPQTGQRGTYTGQVNSINHKPDGKGTVYYNNGSISEGSWSNGILRTDTSFGSDEDHGPSKNDRSRSYSVSKQPREYSRSASRNPTPGYQEPGVGNLHLLSALPGSTKPRVRGGSASVQSYNSRGSHGHVSGSASVQVGYSHYEGGIHGWGLANEYRSPVPPRHVQSNMRSPPMINKRGEYEP